MQQFTDNLVITATDASGNMSSISESVFVDNLGPQITLSYGGAEFAGGRIVDIGLLSVTLSDPYTETPTLNDFSIGENALVTSRSGNVVTVTGPTSLNTTEVPSSTLTVSAQDQFGNISTVSVPAYIDNIAPVVSDLKYDGVGFDGGKIIDVSKLTISVTDGVDNAPSVSATMNGTPLTFTRSGSTYSVTGPVSLNDDQFTADLRITATDDDGNSVTMTKVVTVDNNPPVISNLQNNGIAYEGGKIEDVSKLSFIVEDGLDAAPIVTASINGVPLTLTKSGTTYSVDGPVSLNEDQFTGNLVITAKDADGNTASLTRSLTMDNIGPEINFYLSGQPFSGGQINDISKISVKTNDGYTASPTLNALTFGATSLGSTRSGNTFYVTDPLSLNTVETGTLQLSATISDEFGNITTKSIDAFIDNVGPTVTVKYSETPFGGGRIIDVSQLVVELSDVGSTNLSLDEFKISTIALTTARSADVFEVTGPMVLNTTEIPPTTLLVRGSDDHGNVTTQTIDVFIDNTAPAIKDLRNDTVLFSGGQVRNVALLSFKVTDGVNPDPVVSAAVDGTELLLVQEGSLYNVAGPQTLNDLEFTGVLTITANDGYQERIESVDIIIDNKPPEMALFYDGTTPAEDERYTDITKFTLSLNDTLEPNPALNSATIYHGPLDKTIDLTWERAGNEITFTGPESLYDLEMYPGVVTLEAQDGANNVSEMVFPFVLDNVAPRPSASYEGRNYENDSRVADLSLFQITLDDDAESASVVSAVLVDQITMESFDVPISEIAANTFQLQDPAALIMAEYEGTAVLEVAYEDSWGNAGTVDYSIFNDLTPPVVSVTVDGVEFQEGNLSSLELLNIQIADNNDPTPTVEVVLEDIPTSSTAVVTLESDGTLALPGQDTWGTPGEVRLVVTATDATGNQTVVEKLIDNTPPEITFFEASSEFTDGEIDGFDLFTINLRDGFDLSPSIASIFLDDETTIHTLTTESATPVGASVNYKIVPPALTPTLDKQHCTLTLTASDRFGNESEATLLFDYALRTITTANGGVLLIPAVSHAFTSKDGRQALISEPAYSRDGTLLSGTYDLQATLSLDSETGLVLNGVEIGPGETVIVADDYDFTATEGVIELSAMTTTNGVASDGLLLIQPLTSTAPTMVVDVDAWALDIALTADTWTPQRFFEQWSVGLSQLTETPCQLSSNESLAIGASIFDNPVGLVTLTSNEPTLEVYRETPPSLQGRIFSSEERAINYLVELIDGNGEKITVAQGSSTVTAAPPGDITWVPDQDISSLYQKVGYVEFGLRQQSGPGIILTTNTKRAEDYAELGRLLGVVEWIELPEGLSQDTLYQIPSLQGAINTLGEHRLAWRVSLVNNFGDKYELTTNEALIDVVVPPAPELLFQTNNEVLSDGSVVLSVDGGRAGILTTTAPRRAGNVTLEISGDGVEDITNIYSTGTTLSNRPTVSFNKELSLGSASLWDRSVVTISAYYTDLPEVRNDETLELFRSPPDRISLYLHSDREALDTAGVPYSVTIGDLESYSSVAYDETRHGNWDVELVKVVGSTQEELITKKAMINGESTGIIQEEAGAFAMMAVASIISPEGLFKREINSNRQYVSIYIGTAPEAEVVTQYFAGQAPLRVVLGLSMDTNNRIVLGAVQWEYSVDGGSTWEIMPTNSVPTRLTTTFEEGIYQVRCLAENIKTGEKGYTETVEIQAFNVPTLTLSGSTTVFVGSTATVDAITTYNDQNVDAVVEWRDLGGEVIQTGPSFVAQPTETAGYYLVAFARLPDSPAEEPNAWANKRYNLQAKEPAPPRGVLYLPRYMEAGTEYPIKRRLGLPYLGMSLDDYPIMGEWILPDGSVLPGEDTTYVPTVADAEMGVVTFSYNTWIEGFKEQTMKTLQQRVSVGQYIWPEFQILQSKTFEQAPSTVTLQARPVDYTGRLESPVYTWMLPPSAEIKYDYGARIVVVFNEPGTFEASLNVTDAREQERDVVTQIEVIEADPFIIETVLSPSNKWYHGPLDITVYSRASGGHPQDRMVSFNYFLDGVQIEATTIATVKGLDVGDHVLRVEGTSLMGVNATHEETITVLPNQAPLCEISSEFLESTVNPQYALTATCTDSDGYLVAYRWLIDDSVVGYNNRVGVPEPTEGVITVEFVGTDNTGGEYRSSITLEPHVDGQ